MVYLGVSQAARVVVVHLIPVVVYYIYILPGL